MSLLNNALVAPPSPRNEPIQNYAPGSPERSDLKDALEKTAAKRIEIPLIIGGREIRTGETTEVVMPHDHATVIADCHRARKKDVQDAIEKALAARKAWSALGWENRCAIFLKAADLLSGPWRCRMNAASMLSTSKTAFQAEIDAACELIDFLRFNVWYARNIYRRQPLHNAPGTWNQLQYRPLEGFVLAVTPFNFTAIAGNLATAPALMGNCVLFKPASTCSYTPYLFMQILKEAGLPDGVINFLPGDGDTIGRQCLESPHLAGIHFTGSTATFQRLWRGVSERIEHYRSYPRLVGETGGKDFVVAHRSAEGESLIAALIRGAFEFQGQKCSAASRAYISRTLWETVRPRLLSETARIRTGDVRDFRNFMGALIDRDAFEKVRGYIDAAKNSDRAEIIAGGQCDESRGYFVSPTLILTDDPHFKTLQEEIFGPVLTIYLYEDDRFEEVLELCDATSPYALTGAIFATDRTAIATATARLENAAGNFYINDKPTGAVVGQQPFGGARASGTNDKAGSELNLLRWVSARSIKETFVPPGRFDYPFMDER